MHVGDDRGNRKAPFKTQPQVKHNAYANKKQCQAAIFVKLITNLCTY